MFHFTLHSPDQQLVQPMLEAAADHQRLDLQELEAVVELSDKGRQPQELPEQSQLEPEAPAPVECGDSTLMILPESKCKFDVFFEFTYMIKK